MSNIQQQSKSLQNNVINDGNANNMATNNNNNTSNSCDNQQTTPKALEDTLVNGNDASTTNGNYQQRHLEDWLNATMKASPKTFSVSSAEFLDGASRNALNTNGLGASYAAPPLNLFRMNPTQAGQSPYSFANNLESMYYPSPSHLQSPSTSKLLGHPDFTSLPPVVNLNIDPNQNFSPNDLYDGLDNRHFSDPCLANGILEEEIRQNGNDEKGRIKNQSDNNKMMATLIKQINILHETNSKICRNLSDTKVEIEALKHAPQWGLRNRRDSISGFSTHSQPMGHYTFGTQSPAQTYHSGMYTPGMMTDVVREVKEAARVREEALLSRVRALVEERSWTMNETHLKMIRDLEELKIQVNQLRSEKVESKSHISKLEEEVRSLKTLVAQLLHSGYANTALNPNTPMNVSTPLNNAHNNSISLQNSSNPLILSAYDKQRHLSNRYGNNNMDTDVLKPIQQRFQDMLKVDSSPIAERNGSAQNDLNYTNANNDNNGDLTLIQMEKDNLELRRGLQDALANSKQADQMILKLQSQLQSLQKGQHQQHQQQSQQNPVDNNNVITISTGHTSSPQTNNNQSNHEDFNNPTKIQFTGANEAAKVLSNGRRTSTVNLIGPVTDL